MAVVVRFHHSTLRHTNRVPHMTMALSTQQTTMNIPKDQCTRTLMPDLLERLVNDHSKIRFLLGITWVKRGRVTLSKILHRLMMIHVRLFVVSETFAH